jgi:hypothetical protein
LASLGVISQLGSSFGARSFVPNEKEVGPSMTKYSEIQIDIDNISPDTPLSKLTVEHFVHLLVQVSDQFISRRIPDSETMERIMQLIHKFNSDLARGTQEDIYKKELGLIEQVIKEVGLSVRFPPEISSS